MIDLKRRSRGKINTEILFGLGFRAAAQDTLSGCFGEWSREQRRSSSFQKKKGKIRRRGHYKSYSSGIFTGLQK